MSKFNDYQFNELVSKIRFQTLRYVLAVIEGGSASKAAAILRPCQTSSITRAIANLEDTLGVALFERSPDGLMPTDEGRRFAFAADRMLTHLHNASRNVKRGRVEIYVSELLLGDFLLPALQDVADGHPEITANISLSSAGDAEIALRNNLTQLATIFGIKGNNPEVRVINRIECPLVAVAIKGHPLLAKGTVSPQELLTAKLVLPPRNYTARRLFEGLLLDSNRELQPSMTINSLVYIQQLLVSSKPKNGFVTVLPQLAVWNEPVTARFEVAKIDGAETLDTYYSLCRHESHQISEATELVAKRLSKAFDDYHTARRMLYIDSKEHFATSA